MRKCLQLFFILELLCVVTSVYVDYGAGCFTNDISNAPPDACTEKESKKVRRRVERTLDRIIKRISRQGELGDVNQNRRGLTRFKDFCSICGQLYGGYCVLFGCQDDRRLLLTDEESLRLGLVEEKQGLRRRLQNTAAAEEVLRLELIHVVHDAVDKMISSRTLSPICNQALRVTQCDAVVKISHDD